MKIRLLLGDCIARLAAMKPGSCGAVVCDPPYGLVGTNGSNVTGFLGIRWDRSGVAFSNEFWGAVHRVLQPGGQVKVFSATRTYHRMISAMEQAGFEHIQMEAWGYPPGFPKSVDISKVIDATILFGQSNSVTLTQVEKRRPVVGYKQRVCSSGRTAGSGMSRPGVLANMERWLNSKVQDIPITASITEQAKVWEGWGTALKPAWEPVLVGQKPWGVASRTREADPEVGDDPPAEVTRDFGPGEEDEVPLLVEDHREIAALVDEVGGVDGPFPIPTHRLSGDGELLPHEGGGGEAVRLGLLLLDVEADGPGVGHRDRRSITWVRDGVEDGRSPNLRLEVLEYTQHR